jgi:ribosomal 50S subunit-associated protein YjgA (DUF615 family)
MSLLYAQQVITDIQNRLSDMTKEEIMQALEVLRVTLITEGTKDIDCCFYEEPPDAEEKN